VTLEVVGFQSCSPACRSSSGCFFQVADLFFPFLNLCELHGVHLARNGDVLQKLPLGGVSGYLHQHGNRGNAFGVEVGGKTATCDVRTQPLPFFHDLIRAFAARRLRHGHFIIQPSKFSQLFQMAVQHLVRHRGRGEVVFAQQHFSSGQKWDAHSGRGLLCGEVQHLLPLDGLDVFGAGAVPCQVV